MTYSILLSATTFTSWASSEEFTQQSERQHEAIHRTPNRPWIVPTSTSSNQSFRMLSDDEVFTKKSIEYTGRGYHKKVFRYRLFVSNVSSPEEGLPLIVWLHGLGDGGENNLSQLRYISDLILRISREPQEYPFYILAVQCPADNPRWTTPSENVDDMVNVVLAIIDKTIEVYPIDPDRIVVTGVSSGGSGCWDLAMRRPDQFAGIAPLSSSGGDHSRIKSLVKVPVWAFNNINDRYASIDSVRADIYALQESGGTAYLTEYKASHHDTWSAAFSQDELLEWLLAQRRGSSSWKSTWHSIALVLLLTVFPAVVWWVIRRISLSNRPMTPPPISCA